jgi:hypothetical protein
MLFFCREAAWFNKVINHRQQAGSTSTALLVLCFSATLAQKNDYVPAA